MLNNDYFLYRFPPILKILEKPYMVFTVFQGLRVGMGGLPVTIFWTDCLYFAKIRYFFPINWKSHIFENVIQF